VLEAMSVYFSSPRRLCSFQQFTCKFFQQLVCRAYT